MKYRLSFFVLILSAFINVFEGSKTSSGSEIFNKVLKPSEIIPIKLVNCSNTDEAIYRCVKIEDCETKRHLRNQEFCKWEGNPSHVCCLQEKLRYSSRQKRYNSHYYEDYKPPMRYWHHNFHLGDEDYEDEGYERDYEEFWQKPLHRPHRFIDHRHTPTNYHHNYNNDVYDKNYYFDDWNKNVFSDEEPQCGVLAGEEKRRILVSILGGSAVQTAALNPWMVAIGEIRANKTPQWFCGGSLITRKIILTAAHCVTRRIPNVVRVGELDLTSNTDPAEPQDSEIESAIVHPDYKPPRHYNDIAIIKLKTPVRYTKYVRPICLPPNDGNLYENAQVTLTGWGNIENANENNPVLQEVRISVISNYECNLRYGDPTTIQSNANTLPRGIIDSQLCASDERGGRDACQGDSGGPVVSMNGRRCRVIGIVSSGLGCGSKFYPGIYTRVSSYTDWIRSFL